MICRTFRGGDAVKTFTDIISVYSFQFCFTQKPSGAAGASFIELSARQNDKRH